MSPTRVLGDVAAVGDHHADGLADMADLVRWPAAPGVRWWKIDACDRAAAAPAAARAASSRRGPPRCRPRPRPGRASAARDVDARGCARARAGCAGRRRAAGRAVRRRRRSSARPVSSRGSSLRGQRAAEAGASRSCRLQPLAPRAARPPRCAGSRCSGTGCPTAPRGPRASVGCGCSSRKAVMRHQDARACSSRTAGRGVREGLLQRIDSSPGAGARPSTVVISCPSACTANIRHERTGAPSRRTVQAPQTPCSQPTCVPVRPSSWRRKSDSSRRGSTSRVRRAVDGHGDRDRLMAGSCRCAPARPRSARARQHAGQVALIGGAWPARCPCGSTSAPHVGAAAAAMSASVSARADAARRRRAAPHRRRPGAAAGQARRAAAPAASQRHHRGHAHHRVVAAPPRHLEEGGAGARRQRRDADRGQHLVGRQRRGQRAEEEVGAPATSARRRARCAARSRRSSASITAGISEAGSAWDEVAAQRAAVADLRVGDLGSASARSGAAARRRRRARPRDGASWRRSRARRRRRRRSPASPATRFRSTSTAGCATRKFIAGTRLCPPARKRASSPCRAFSATA